jgi:hypothetical protein
MLQNAVFLRVYISTNAAEIGAEILVLIHLFVRYFVVLRQRSLVHASWREARELQGKWRGKQLEAPTDHHSPLTRFAALPADDRPLPRISFFLSPPQ